MTSTPPDWSAIQSNYEQGMSLRDIVAKHGSSIATISRVARHEGWVRQVKPIETRNMKHETPMPLPPKLLQLPIPDDAVSIARIGLHQLAQHLQSDTMLEVRDHKSLSDALAQYVKVLQTAPQEPESKEGLVIPLEKLSPSTRQEIRRLLVEDARQQERTG